jgi:N-acetylmuramoyl-L-alanine amidase
MSGTYLTWLADELRAAGLVVIEYDGWQNRARSSGGYAAGRPWGVMWHHTASQTSPANDASYMCHGSDDRPIANLLIARDGAVWVLAAGATNTNGKGGPWSWSRGTVPVDSMNVYAVGMEIANGGTGETYPQSQIDAAFGASVAIVRRLQLDDGDCCQHVDYAPTRKIDPATAGAVQGPWRPRSVNSSGSWALADLVDEHRRRCGSAPSPAPPTPEDDDDMRSAVYQASDDPQGPWLWWDGRGIGWVRDAAQLPVGRVMGVYSNTADEPLRNFTAAQLRAICSSSWADSGPRPEGY